MTVSCAVGDVEAQRATLLAVQGVRNPRSVGVSRYATRLASALGAEHVDYRLAARGTHDRPIHYHLANSSRAFLAEAAVRRGGFAVTVHDVVPRTRALHPLYRGVVYPQLVRRAAGVVVHSAFAADLLLSVAGRRPVRLEVIAHPAHAPAETDRDGARRALGWPDNVLIAVLPGAIRRVKLVGEALAAVAGARGWRLALAGRVADAGLAARARAAGALVLGDPSDADYDRAIVAADCVLCLRSGSVGETNGPLLDAVGARRAVLATQTGSIPEIAGGAALTCGGTVAEIRAGLALVERDDVRAELEHAAARRAAELTWQTSAELHAALFREVLDAL